MKKLILSSITVMAGMALAFMLTYQPAQNALAGEGCYNCSSSSKANQCKWHGSDTYDQRKKCEAAGCDITGTSSCSTAANVKVIDPNN